MQDKPRADATSAKEGARQIRPKSPAAVLVSNLQRARVQQISPAVYGCARLRDPDTLHPLHTAGVGYGAATGCDLVASWRDPTNSVNGFFEFPLRKSYSFAFCDSDSLFCLLTVDMKFSIKVDMKVDMKVDTPATDG